MSKDPSQPSPSPDWVTYVDAAADTCIAPSEIDIGHIAQLARGEALPAHEAPVTAHLDRCLHCQLQYEALKALAAPGALPPPPERFGTTGEFPIPTPAPFFLHRARRAGAAAAGVAALVAVALAAVWVGRSDSTRPPLPGLELAEAKGMIATQMGPTDARAVSPSEPLSFAPTGTISLVVRLDRQLAPELSPELGSYYVDARRRLRGLPESYVTTRRSPGWISQTLAVPVQDVLGSTPGGRTLVFCVSYAQGALRDLEGAPEGSADSDERACERLAVEVVGASE